MAVDPVRSTPTGPEPTGERRAGEVSDRPATAHVDAVDEWGRQSFPASDPPQNW